MLAVVRHPLKLKDNLLKPFISSRNPKVTLKMATIAESLKSCSKVSDLIGGLEKERSLKIDTKCSSSSSSGFVSSCGSSTEEVQVRSSTPLLVKPAAEAFKDFGTVKKTPPESLEGDEFDNISDGSLDLESLSDSSPESDILSSKSNEKQKEKIPTLIPFIQIPSSIEVKRGVHINKINEAMEDPAGNFKTDNDHNKAMNSFNKRYQMYIDAMTEVFEPKVPEQIGGTTRMYRDYFGNRPDLSDHSSMEILEYMVRINDHESKKRMDPNILLYSGKIPGRELEASYLKHTRRDRWATRRSGNEMFEKELQLAMKLLESAT